MVTDPSWVKDPGIGNRLINALGETLATKPAFRIALRKGGCGKSSGPKLISGILFASCTRRADA